MMDKRVLVLVVAACIIAGLCLHKAMRTYPEQPVGVARVQVRPAPRFELYDQTSPSKLVRLDSFLGRHRILVIFFDGKAGAHQSAALQEVRDDFGRLRKADVHVIAISTALPQENRRDAREHAEFPFPLLSDPALDIQRAWGRIDSKSGQPTTGVFLVDRSGSVAWSAAADSPQPIENWKTLIRDLADER